MAVTERELLARHEQLQQRVAQERTSEGAGPTEPELGRDEHRAVCPDCDKLWTYPVVVLDGSRTVPPREDERQCPACVALQDQREREQLEAEERRRAEASARKREEHILELLAEAGANPWEHGECTLASFDTSECGAAVTEAVIAFLGRTRSAGPYDPVQGLYLWGATGTGKSHLATAAFSALLRDPHFDPREIVFDNALDLITRIQDTYSTGKSTLDLIDRRINARVWILDDLGSEQASADVVRRLTLILTRRAMRPTLITGNFDPDTYESRADELFRIGSRLGPRYFDVIEVKGRDRRFD